MKQKRRVLLLAQDGESTRIVFNALSPEFDICAVVLEAPMPRKEFVERRLRKLGARTVVGQLAFRALLVPALSMRAKRRIAEICTRYGLDTRAIDPTRCVHVPSVNAPECAELLRNYDPDLIVVNGTRIISRQTLAAVRARFVNIHVGLTPLYRGVHGGYWALATGRPEQFGVTIHVVDSGIDTGPILGQAHASPTRQDNFVTYPYLQYAVGVPLLKRVVGELLLGEERTQPAPAGQSKLWSHPTLGQYLGNLLRARVW